MMRLKVKASFDFISYTIIVNYVYFIYESLNNSLILFFIADTANNEIGASNECMTEDLAKEMKNQKVLIITLIILV